MRITYITITYSILFLALCLFTACNERSSEIERNHIAINEVGYHPDSPKLAVLPLEIDSGETFQILDAESLQPLFEGTVQMGMERDMASGDVVHNLDFSEFNKPGTYRLFIPGKEYKSSPFQINYSVYNNAVLTAMESFYYHRCGTEVDNGTPWTHPACHLDDAPFYDNPERTEDVTGGWHDAGDYAKFIVTTAVSAAFQLYLFEHKPGHFTDGQLNIPESGNDIPDLLDEVRWALEWMLKMQNEEGGVWFKVSEKRWTGEYLPHRDPDTRYIFEISSTATADFAAITALASRLYDDYDPAFATRLKAAAENAWKFLEIHPDIVPEGGFTNPPDVQGGEYRDSRDLDERLWASVELYRLTGEEKYHDWFLEHYRQLGGPQRPPLSWQNVTGFAWSSYLRISESQQDPDARQHILSHLIAYADRLVERIEQSGYRLTLRNDEFYWGSNSVALGYAFELVQVYEFSGMKTYKWAALDQLHYIMGRNPFGISYVTGVGYNSARNPYHQFSMRLNHNDPVPGMVVGGPNSSNRLDGRKLSEYPAKAYEDWEKNYMVNETAINYTAPFIYLAGYFSDFNFDVTIPEMADIPLFKTGIHKD